MLPWRCLAALSAVLLLLSDAGIADAQPAGGPPDVHRPRSQTDCEAAGGTWRRMGLRGVERCELRAPDAGRPCQSSADCTAVCVTDEQVPAGTPVTGRCFDALESVGHCYNPVHRGVARGVVCKD